MLSLLRTGRWIAFTAAAVLAIVAFGLLSLWQWHRAEEKRADFATVETAMTAEPIPVTSAGDPAEWQRVTATGAFDPGSQFLVRNRPQSGSNGFWVVTRFDTGAEGLWVVRGFTPATASAGATTTAPAPPSGSVDLTAYVRTTEAGPARAAEDLPAGQVTAVNVADLDRLAAASTLPWFAIASEPRTAGLSPIPLPEATDSRNLSYAGQWLLFAAITIGGWFYFLRREARDQATALDVGRAPVEVKG